MAGGNDWTKRDEERLKRMWVAGKAVIVICHALNRTPNAIYRRRRDLGLPLRYPSRRENGLRRLINQRSVE